jgi:hypothetical protein
MKGLLPEEKTRRTSAENAGHSIGREVGMMVGKG